MPRSTNQNTNKIKMMPEHIWKSVTIISRLTGGNNKILAKIQVT